MTRGRTGLVLVMFGFLCWISRVIGIPAFQDFGTPLNHAIAAVSAFGMAICVAAFLIRMIDA